MTNKFETKGIAYLDIKPRQTLVRLLLWVVVLYSACSVLPAYPAQTLQDRGTLENVGEDEQTRDMPLASWREGRAKSLQHGKSKTGASPVYSTSNRSLKRPPNDDAQIGITLFRLQKTLNVNQADIRELTPARVGNEDSLSEGDLIFFQIETLRRGYLYLINHVEYKDGTSRDWMLFPHPGRKKNKMGPGQILAIPDSIDQLNYLRVKLGKSDSGALQQRESLIVIVSAIPISEATSLLQSGAEEGRVELGRELINQWISRWGSGVTKLELRGGRGQQLSMREREASLGSTRLDSGDPYPQLVYTVRARPSATLLVEIQLPIKTEAR